MSEEWFERSGQLLLSSTLHDALKRVGGRFKKHVWPKNGMKPRARNFETPSF